MPPQPVISRSIYEANHRGAEVFPDLCTTAGLHPLFFGDPRNYAMSVAYGTIPSPDEVAPECVDLPVRVQTGCTVGALGAQCRF